MTNTPLRRFQRDVAYWANHTFGFDSGWQKDRQQRAFRFFEEAVELAQACNVTKEDCVKLVEYVYSRPEGEVKDEVSGTLSTLSALCTAYDIDLDTTAHFTIDMLWKKVEKVRRKHATIEQGSPLPGGDCDAT